jgi:colanic acid/amylovoran biosynthesis glycosyltransferase
MSQKIAYIMSRFPTIAETFILYEILELKRLGLHIEIFPLIHQKEAVSHREVEMLERYVHYPKLLSIATLLAQLYWLYTKPKTYGRVWWRTVRGNLKSPKFLSRALVVLPLAALYAREMAELDIKHIHAHWATHPALAAYIIKQLTGISYSFTAHSGDIFFEQSMLEEKIHQANFVVTISEYSRKFLCNLYDERITGKIHVIHCGIDLEAFQTGSSKPPDAPFTLICVARLDREKGHHYLVEACAQLKAQGMNFRCLLVGEGDTRAELEAQIQQLGLTDQIILLGLQPRHRVLELLAQADVKVLPSISEGIPVSLMEALAMGLPAVATAISGVPELIEDGQTGLLVPTCDVQALTTAISKLYRTRNLGQQLGAKGRIKVMEEFNLRISAANLYRLFTKDQAQADLSIG